MPARSDASSKALKVLFIPAWYPSKDDPMQGIFVREHARAVAPYCDVAVLYSSPASITVKGWYVISSDRIEEGIRTVRVHYRRLPIPKTTYLVYILSILGGYGYLTRQGFRPDILHAHVFQAGVPTVLLGRRDHIPVIITEHWSGFPRRLLSWPQRLMARFAFNQADVVCPVSESLRQHIEAYSIRARFQIIPNPVNTALFYPHPAKERNRDGRKRILFVGMLIPVKGLSYLLEALGRLKSQRDDFVLDVVGDGPSRTEYESMVSGLGLDGVVRFHGARTLKEVAEFMRSCDFLVSSSLQETFGIVLVEALATGKPVIATRTGASSEIVDGSLGSLIRPGDVDALVESLVQMLDTARAYSSDHLARYAHERFGYQAVGHKMYQIYEQCIGRQPGSYECAI